MICEDLERFKEFINTSAPEDLDISRLKNVIKLPSITKMPFDELQQYFRQEFQNTRTEKRTKWHDTDKYLLILCVSKYIETQGIKIQEMTQFNAFNKLSEVLGLPADFLLKKWISLLKQNLKDQPWNEEEDQLLIELRKKYPGSKDWTQITEEFIERTNIIRYQKQIRERFNNVINPKINKDPFSKEEILFIIQQAQDKKKNWAGISRLMNGRTDNKIKNIYNSTLKKIAKKMGKNLKDEEEEKQILEKIKLNQTIDPNEFNTQIDPAQNQKKKCEVKEENSEAVQSNQSYQANSRISFQDTFSSQKVPQIPYIYQPNTFLPMPILGYYYPCINQNIQQSPFHIVLFKQ